MRPPLLEASERGGALGPIEVGEHRQRCEHIRHILPGLELRDGERRTLVRIGSREIGEAGIAQCSPADRPAIDTVGARIGELLCRRRRARPPRLRRAPPGRSRGRRGWRRRRRRRADRRETPRSAKLSASAAKAGSRSASARVRRIAATRSGSSARGALAALMGGNPVEQQLASRPAGRLPSGQTARCRARRGISAGRAARPSA